MTPPRQLTVAVSTLVAIAFGAGVAAADPIIVNGNFSLGSSGFTSGYTSGYTSLSSRTLSNQGLMYSDGTFTVGPDPSQVHPLWASFGDHTTGDGGMMIVNGSCAADVMVWSASVDVTPDTEYDFSAWAASVYPWSPSSLAFSINGTLLGDPFSPSLTAGLWEQFGATWYSGTRTTAMISLVNRNTEFHGNDFALDDISLREQPFNPVPDGGTTWMLLGGALVGLGTLRRKLGV